MQAKIWYITAAIKDRRYGQPKYRLLQHTITLKNTIVKKNY